MQGFLIRLARALNRAWGCTGKVFLERFHSSVIEHYWSLRRAVRYVLQNARKHGIALPEDQPDFYSSGPWFRGWSGRNGQPFDTSEPPVSLMEWTGRYLEDQRRILIGLTELPGPSP